MARSRCAAARPRPVSELAGRALAAFVIAVMAIAATAISPAAAWARPKKRPAKPSLAKIDVVSTRLAYMPDQEGGNWHDALAVVENHNRFTVTLSGQFSIFSASGELLKTTRPNPVTLAPGESAPMLDTVIDLPQPAPDGYVKLYLRLMSYTKPTPPQVWLSDIAYRPPPPDSISGRGCTITGVVHNTLPKATSLVGISAITMSAGQLVAGDYTYLYDLMPGLDATFQIKPPSPTQCPPAVDAVLAHVEQPHP
jgi:hypothetical protein